MNPFVRKTEPQWDNESLEAYAQNMLSGRTNDMTKIQVKCWLYHSKSRLKNGNPPFGFKEFNTGTGKQLYLEYLSYGFINCDDMGGKEYAEKVIEHWYS